MKVFSLIGWPDYTGDSAVNSLSDIVCGITGYAIGFGLYTLIKQRNEKLGQKSTKNSEDSEDSEDSEEPEDSKESLAEDKRKLKSDGDTQVPEKEGILPQIPACVGGNCPAAA